MLACPSAGIPQPQKTNTQQMKTTLSLALALWCLGVSLRAQNLAEWTLSSGTAADTTAANLTADTLKRGAGISAIDFNSNQANAFAWNEANAPGAADYFEVCISADTGYQLQVDSLFFKEQRSADGIAFYQLAYSTDGFQTSTLLLTDTLPDDELLRSVLLSKININPCADATLCLRWFGYGTEDHGGEWALSDINLYGAVDTVCVPPADQLSTFNADSIGPNSARLKWSKPPPGNFVAVVARELGQPEVLPCNGSLAFADSTFGAGTDYGQGNYLIYAGDGTGVNMQGLEAGQQYEVTAMTYDPVTFCYRRSDALRLDFTTDCANPIPATALLAFPGDSSATLNWDFPSCGDDVLLLGSQDTVDVQLSNPNGNNFPTDTVYGQGSGGGLPNDVFALYQGSGERVTVTNLLPDSTYFFRLYTRKDTNWVGGPTAALSPQAPCPETGEFVFFSELHYNNTGPIVIDPGVELTGQAGLDLSNYQISVYVNTFFMTSVGNNGYLDLQGTISDDLNGIGAVWVSIPELPTVSGAVVLYNEITGEVADAITYRTVGGALQGGPGDGLDPPSTVFTENSNTPINHSLQRGSNGLCPLTGNWNQPTTSSPGVLNSSQGGPLPISLLSFTARRSGNVAELQWRTETELNNDYMAVEHSTDGRIYTEIGQVPGAGTTQIPQDYHFTHGSPAPGLNYYRLRQVDYDGQAEYHGPVSVRHSRTAAQLRLFPSPVQSALTLDFRASRQQPGNFLLFDAYGRMLQRIPHDGGPVQKTIAVETLATGTYTLLWMVRGEAPVAARFVKK